MFILPQVGRSCVRRGHRPDRHPQPPPAPSSLPAWSASTVADRRSVNSAQGVLIVCCLRVGHDPIQLQLEVGEGTLAFGCSTVSPHVGEPRSPETSWISRRTSHHPRGGSRDLDIAARWRETSPISCSNPKSTMGSHDRRAISTSPLPRTQSPPVGPPEIPGQARDDHTNRTAAGGDTGTSRDDRADGLTAAGAPSVIPGLPRDLLLGSNGCASGCRSR